LAVETIDIRSLRVLAQMINAEHERRAIQIVSGAASSLEAYRGECGFLRGLEAVLEMIKDVEAEVYGKIKEAKT